MGPDRVRTRDPWICSQTGTCSQTRYSFLKSRIQCNRRDDWTLRTKKKIFSKTTYVVGTQKNLFKMFLRHVTQYKSQGMDNSLSE